MKKKNKMDKKMLTKKQDRDLNKDIKLSSKVGIIEIDSNKFSDLVEKIYKKNSLKPFPDINDIPN